MTDAMEDSPVGTMAQDMKMSALDSRTIFDEDDFDTQDSASDIGVSVGSDTDEEDIRERQEEEKDYQAMVNAVGAVDVNATTLDEDIERDIAEQERRGGPFYEEDSSTDGHIAPPSPPLLPWTFRHRCYDDIYREQAEERMMDAVGSLFQDFSLSQNGADSAPSNSKTTLGSVGAIRAGTVTRGARKIAQARPYKTQRKSSKHFVSHGSLDGNPTINQYMTQIPVSYSEGTHAGDQKNNIILWAAFIEPW